MTLRQRLTKWLGAPAANELLAKSPRVWLATLTQTSTDAPVATIHRADFPVVITYNSAGTYTLTNAGIVSPKAHVTVGVGNSNGLGTHDVVSRMGIGSCRIITYDFATGTNEDEILLDTPIKIEIWD